MHLFKHFNELLKIPYYY